MLLFHIHCGAKRVSFKEASPFSLLSTLWVHLSLAYTVRTKHIPSIFTLWGYFSLIYTLETKDVS